MKKQYLVINLDRSHDRLAAAAARLEALGIEWTRVPAVDGRQTPPKGHPRYDDRTARLQFGRSLVGGELGCFDSHRRALSQFLESDADCGVILEDDANPCRDFDEVLTAALRLLADRRITDWRVLHLGSTRPRFTRLIERIQGNHAEYRLLEAHYFPMTTPALCWSRTGAAEFLGLSESITAPVDNRIQDWLCRKGGGLAIRPALVTAIPAESTIDSTAAGAPLTRDASRPWFASLIKAQRLWRNRYWASTRRFWLMLVC